MKKIRKIVFFTFLFCVLLLVIFWVLASFYANKNQIYVNEKYGYSFFISKRWHPAVEISKIFSIQRYYSFEAAKINCQPNMIEYYFNGNVSDQQKQEAFYEYNNCLKNSPDYDKLQKEIADYEKNWSLFNSDVVYFTDLSDQELKKILPAKQISLSKFDLPKGHFISIYPWDTLIEIKEPKKIDKDGKILETKLIDMAYARLENVTLTDARRLSQDPNISGYLDVNIPYTPKSNDEFLKQFKSIVISTDIPYGDKRESVFYQIIKYFKFE